MSALETDAQLMLRVKRGEDVYLGALLSAYRAPVIRYLYRMVQDQSAAEELAQDVFLRVYKARASYEATAKFSSWLYRIATNLALNWLRHSRHERNYESLDAVLPHRPQLQIEDRRPTIDRVILDQDRLNEIRNAIAELPARQRAVVLMHKYEEMDYAEIARALNCTVPTVKSLLFRAYSALRTRLGHLAACN
jgi:RNA polymerase sigma-70 factor (ECF subfamily)